MSGLFMILHTNGSSDKVKSRGDNGQPCLVPFGIGRESGYPGWKGMLGK